MGHDVGSAGRDDSLDERIAGALGTGSGAAPSTLVEAIAARVVDVTRQEVAIATKAVTELSGRIGRLEGELAGIRKAVDQADDTRSAASSEPPSGPDLTDLLAGVDALAGRLGDVERRLDETARAAARVESSVQRVEHQGSSTAPATAVDALRADVTNVRADVAALRGAIEEVAQRAAVPAPAPDLAPVTDAVRASLSGLRGAVDGLARAVAVPPPAPDLGGVTDAVGARVDELRTLIQQVADQLVGRAESSELRALGETVAEQLNEVRVAVDDVARATASPPPAPDLAPVVEAIAVVRAAVDDLARAQATAEPPDLTPLLDAVHEHGAAGRAALDELTSAVADDHERVVARIDALVRPLTTMPEALAASDARLDSMAADQREHLTTALEQVRHETVTHAQSVERRVEALSGLVTQLAQQLAATRGELERLDVDALSQQLTAAIEAVGSRVEEQVGRLDTREELAAAIEAVGARVEEQVGRLDALQGAIDGLAEGLTAVRAAMGGDEGNAQLDRALTVMTEVRWDVEATQERVGDIDRKLAALRADLADTAQIAHGTYQAADAVSAGLSALARMERRLDADLEGMTRQLDALAAAVELAAIGVGRPGGIPREQAATQVAERLHRYRQIAAGVRDALRDDILRRRATSTPPALGPAEVVEGERKGG